jgi:hypothetical protein
VTENLPANTDPSDVAALVGAALPAHTDVAAVLGIMVPIVAIVFGISLAMLGLWFDFRKKREQFQLHHTERMAAIEKGIELPPLPSEFFRDNRRRERTPIFYLRRGLMWLLIGLSVTAALWGTDEKDFWWGLVPSAVGVAYLLSYLVERGHPPKPGDPESH